MRRLGILLIVVLVAGIGAGYWFLHRPAQEALEQARSEEANARGRISQMERVLSQVEVGTGELEELTQYRREIETVLPGPFDMTQILAEMPEMPARFGLRSPGGSGRINAKFTDIKTHPQNERLTYIDFTYEIIGTLDQFDELFNYITTHRPLFTVESFAGSQTSESQNWRGTLVVRVWATDSSLGANQAPRTVPDTASEVGPGEDDFLEELKQGSSPEPPANTIEEPDEGAEGDASDG